MDAPDKRQFYADCESAAFRAGVLRGQWDFAEAACVPEADSWPKAYFWLKAMPREQSPDRYYVIVDGEGYRTVSPTATFWDPDAKAALADGARPTFRPGSRAAKIFRTDWEQGRAFYHPYDRVAASGHPNWRTEIPSVIWTEDHTIVDFLAAFQPLLQGGDYLGVRAG